MLVVYASPLIRDDIEQFLRALLRIDGVRLALLTQDRPQRLTPDLADALVALERVEDSLDTGQVHRALQSLKNRFGPIHRLLAVNEQIQVPLAEMRERFGVQGMGVEAAVNFRDKARMKYLFEQNGVPCARSGCATSSEEVRAFVERVGLPIVLKPLAGAATQSTFRAIDAPSLAEALASNPPSPHNPVLLEEFVTGEERTLETLSLNGRPLWHSVTQYSPTALHAVETPWIQWCLLTPTDPVEAGLPEIQSVGERAIAALGMGTGMSHLEWFRQADGRVVVGEVAARPPGSQIFKAANYAYDMCMYTTWTRLMVLDDFVPPPLQRRYAVGSVFLRGHGGSRIVRTHGLEEALAHLGEMVVEGRTPRPGETAHATYTGNGYVQIRHAETSVVRDALRYLQDHVRVELA